MSSEGGGTYWWALSLGKQMVGDSVASESLSVSLSSVAVIVHFCPSWDAVHHSLLSIIHSCVHCVLLSGFALLALHLAMGEVDGDMDEDSSPI